MHIAQVVVSGPVLTATWSHRKTEALALPSDTGLRCLGGNEASGDATFAFFMGQNHIGAGIADPRTPRLGV
ncbi:hypothetical protein [Tateyamaria pelophila]|uniref:hypothetical protein n=1 Tax=Tateyamaria pelophila TaxID=328415 RepID=UPI001CBAA5DD|nr:hypothetical protein [Tateyamaria pelophila]